ncbi:MAG: hypothetical protein MHM6MM_001440 [Cercozoa sp. M6MM]
MWKAVLLASGVIEHAFATCNTVRCAGPADTECAYGVCTDVSNGTHLEARCEVLPLEGSNGAVCSTSDGERGVCLAGRCQTREWRLEFAGDAVEAASLAMFQSRVCESKWETSTLSTLALAVEDKIGACFDGFDISTQMCVSPLGDPVTSAKAGARITFTPKLLPSLLASTKLQEAWQCEDTLVQLVRDSESSLYRVSGDSNSTQFHDSASLFRRFSWTSLLPRARGYCFARDVQRYLLGRSVQMHADAAEYENTTTQAESPMAGQMNCGALGRSEAVGVDTGGLSELTVPSDASCAFSCPSALPQGNGDSGDAVCSDGTWKLLLADCPNAREEQDKQLQSAVVGSPAPHKNDTLIDKLKDAIGLADWIFWIIFAGVCSCLACCFCFVCFRHLKSTDEDHMYGNEADSEYGTFSEEGYTDSSTLPSGSEIGPSSSDVMQSTEEDTEDMNSVDSDVEHDNDNDSATSESVALADGESDAHASMKLNAAPLVKLNHKPMLHLRIRHMPPASSTPDSTPAVSPRRLV